jgi:RNA polymerase sigma-70 factor (ECF subfamily)
LRQFRGESSLTTYVTVVARRICVNELAKRAGGKEVPTEAEHLAQTPAEHEEAPKALVGLENLEEVERLLRKLPGKERDVVRLYYLEGLSYEEISTDLDIPVNSIGPILSRARKKLRGGGKLPA